MSNKVSAERWWVRGTLKNPTNEKIRAGIEYHERVQHSLTQGPYKPDIPLLTRRKTVQDVQGVLSQEEIDALDAAHRSMPEHYFDA